MMTKRKVLLHVAGLAGVGAVAALATALPAQEKEREGEPRHEEHALPMRSFVFGAGSYLGVMLEEVDAEGARRLGLGEPRGALVGEVVEDSPASTAGLQKDDVIVSWNGARVESAIQLRRLVGETPPGRTVRIGVARDGREREISATLGEHEGRGFAPRARLHMAPRMDRDRFDELREHMRLMRPGDGEYSVFLRSERGRLGVTMQGLGDQLGAYFGVEGGKGALVASVREDSPASRAGLRAGDVIVRIGDEDVEDPGEAARLVGDADAGPISITVVRDKQRRTLTAELPEREEMRIRSVPAEGRALELHVPEIEFPGIVIPEIGIPSFTITIPEFELPRVVLPAEPGVAAVRAAPSLPPTAPAPVPAVPAAPAAPPVTA